MLHLISARPPARQAGAAAPASRHRLDALTSAYAAGDAVLGELLDEYPSADRQQLRQLVRNALDERAKDKPPRAFRELYRALHALLGDGEQAGEDHDQPA